MDVQSKIHAFLLEVENLQMYKVAKWFFEKTSSERE